MSCVKKGDGEREGMVQMEVGEVCSDPFTEMPLLILRSDDRRREIALLVGAGEATSIAAALQKIPLQRPATHDLMTAICERGGLRVVRVEIRDLVDGTYYAALIVDGPRGEFEVDARPSDAVALALRAGAPILVARRVIERTAAIGVDPTAEPEGARPSAPREEPYRDYLESLPDEEFGKWKM